jgi:hypothetical protein
MKSRIRIGFIYDAPDDRGVVEWIGREGLDMSPRLKWPF